MDPLQRFGAYAADFEKTYRDDDWTRLEPYFAEDAVYTIEGVPFACEIRGRDAIFRAIKKSLDGFDRRMDKREIGPGGVPVVASRRITVSGSVRYEKQGSAPISIRLSETAEFDEAGLIVRLHDVYPEGQEAAIAWIEGHQELDPSYV
jgi:hypothetical protein